MVGCVPTTGRAQKLWGGHGQMMDTMWVQVVIVETPRWHGSVIFWPGKGGSVRGWCLGACREGAHTHMTGKTKQKANNKKSKKRTHWKHRPPQASRVLCVCVASVRAHRRGVRRYGIRRVFVGALRWHGCFDFWAQGRAGRHAGCWGRRVEGRAHEVGGKKN